MRSFAPRQLQTCQDLGVTLEQTRTVAGGGFDTHRSHRSPSASHRRIEWVWGKQPQSFPHTSLTHAVPLNTQAKAAT